MTERAQPDATDAAAPADPAGPVDVAIVGGGAVGVALAWRLAGAGARVELLERGALGAGASAGNAGQLRFSECVPLAAPGAVRETLRSAFKRDAPVRVGLRPSPERIRWLARFARAARTPIAHRAEALALLGHESAEAFERIAGELPPEVAHRRGALDVYESARGLASAAAEAELTRAMGFACELLDAKAARACEPGLGEAVAGAVHFPGDGSLDPTAFVAWLAEQAAAAGAVLQRATAVERLVVEGERLVGVATSRRIVRARHTVLAGGFEAGTLPRALGHRLPLLAGKGYSVDVEPRTAALALPTVLMERHGAATPFSDRVRLASHMVVGATDTRVPPGLAERLLTGVSEPLPALRGARIVRSWAGLRPLTPDGMPLIGAVRALPGLWVAAGHGMLGITYALGTAELLAAAIEGSTPPAGLAAFAPDRRGA